MHRVDTNSPYTAALERRVRNHPFRHLAGYDSNESLGIFRLGS